MRTTELGDKVQVRYKIRTQSGTTGTRRGLAPIEVIIGSDHPRLPGLGSALVGLAPGMRVTVQVPSERGFGPHDPARVLHWPRERLPRHVTLMPGKLVRMTNDRGRQRFVRIVEVNGDRVVVDTNHPWAGRALELEVELIAIVARHPVPNARGSVEN